jgi:hypothetical protein
MPYAQGIIKMKMRLDDDDIATGCCWKKKMLMRIV